MATSQSKMEEGQGQPENASPPVPYSIFTARQKALIVTLVSVAATFSGLASNIYFPSIPAVAADLSVSPELINLSVTSYMVFQGLSPTVWGAVSDVRGRRITYFCTFLIFFGACIGLAETRHFYQLIILRCLQSAGSASTIAIGAGVMGDITTREERGGYMGIFQAGLLVPLSVGPILGGVFSQTLGWRAIFWFLTIYSGVFLVILFVSFPETLRSLVGNGSLPAKGISETPIARLQRHRHTDSANSTLEDANPLTAPKKQLSIDFLGPLRILFGTEVALIIIFLAIYYTVWQMTITAMSTLFKTVYNLSEIQIGLTFIGNGVGCMGGTLLMGKVLDFDYRRIKAGYKGKIEDFPLESARLRTIWLWSGLQCVSVIVFGWTLDRHVHISVPIICTFVLGWAANSTQSVITTFLVDVFPKQGASATAALNLARCLMGAGGTAFILPMINSIGAGWGFTILTTVMVSGLALVALQMHLGQQWRRKREENENLTTN